MKIETALFISENDSDKTFYQHYWADQNEHFTTRKAIGVLNPVAKFNLKPKKGETKVPQISCFIKDGQTAKLPF